MKKNIAILIFTMCLFSCENRLDVPLQSNIATGNFFKSQSDFDLALAGAYDPLGSHQPNNGLGTYFRGLLYMGRVGTDEMYATSQFQTEWEFSNYTFTPFNETIERVWEFQYQGISRANTIIDRLPVALATGIKIQEDEVNRILGEAHFLRGFFYFQLARMYGGVPLVVKEVTDLDGLSLERASLADTYAQIISDFEKAEELLPISNQNGRARKYAASTFLAKAYLQMSGEPLNNAEAADKALEYTTKIINESGFALLTNYGDVFDWQNEYHSEYIFDVEYTFCGNCEGGQVGTWEGVPDFDFTQSYTLVRTYADFYWTYNDIDLRRDWNIAHYRIIDENGTTEPLIVGDSTYYAYKWRHPTKRSERPPGFFEWQSPFNFPLTRYADVLLMHAEAIWRVAGAPSSINNAEALDAINQVRRRGFGKPIFTPDPTVDITTISGEAILNERKWELCWEGHRWHDLVRFGKLKEAVMSINYTHDNQLPRPDLGFQDYMTLFPIPQSQIDVSKGKLLQNTGY